MTPTTEQIEAEITRRWNSLSYNSEGVISRESLRHQVLKDFNVDYTLEQISTWKAIAEILSSVFFHGDFTAETENERTLEQKMREVGLWPTTEAEIIKRSQLREQQ